MAVTIPNLTRAEKISFILKQRHGSGGKRDLALSLLNVGHGPMMRPPTQAIVEAEVLLEALSATELDAEYEIVRREAMAEYEAGLWYNSPSTHADFAHWAKCAYWQIHEAVALVLGRDPTVISPGSLKPLAKHVPLVRDFNRLLDLANRAVLSKQLMEVTQPGAFIVWAKRYDIPVPVELEEAVKKYGHLLRDWKTMFDQAQTQLKEVLLREQEALTGALTAASLHKAQLEGLAAQFQALRSSQAEMPVQRAGADVRELESLRKLVITMAMIGYKYDPRAMKSDKIAEIVGDLERLDLTLHRDTVRKYLQEAAELLSPDAMKAFDEGHARQRPR